MPLKPLARCLGALAFVGAAQAGDFGTAGLITELQFIDCSPSSAARAEGACDPAPVADTGSSEQRSAAYLARAQHLIRLFRTEEAVNDLDAAIRINPRNMAARVFSARYHLSWGVKDRGEVELNTVLLVAPREPAALATRAALRQMRRDLVLARADIEAALTQTPDDPDMLMIRARIGLDQHLIDPAMADIDRAILARPSDPRYRSLRVDLLLRQERYEAAIPELDLLLAQSPRRTDYLRKRAVAHLGLNDEAGAADALAQAFDVPERQKIAMLRVPEWRELAVRRAVLLARLGRSAEAMTVVESLLAASDMSVVLRLQLYLRGKGYPEIAIDGKRTEPFDAALKRCFADTACGAGIGRRA